MMQQHLPSTRRGQISPALGVCWEHRWLASKAMQCSGPSAGLIGPLHCSALLASRRCSQQTPTPQDLIICHRRSKWALPALQVEEQCT